MQPVKEDTITQQNAPTPHTVVTGGAGGIGAATIEALLNRGHKVSSFDLSRSSQDGVHSEIVDVTDEAAVSAAMDRAIDRFGPVTGLVASHGIRGAFVPAMELSLDHVRRLFDIHVVGALVVSRQMATRLDGLPGSIVLLSSTTAYGGWVNQSDYGPAKAAERQLAENLAIEWAPLGIRVNSIAPGHTLTAMVQDLVDTEDYDLRETEQRMPMGRLARPQEMADAIVWALCDATFMTGQCVAIDGGWTAVGK